MRAVVDTNVVVSAILRDRLPEEVLLFIIGLTKIISVSQFHKLVCLALP